MMRVIHVMTDTNFGGAGTYLLSFLDYYDKSQIELEVFIPYQSKLKDALLKRKVRFTEVAYINDASFNKKAVGQLVKLFRAKKPDIVHTHAALSARIAARVCGCKIVHTRHSVFTPPSAHTTFPGKLVLGLINNLLSDTIIAVSPAAKKNLTDTGTSAKKVQVIMNGMTAVQRFTEAERVAARQKYKLSPEDFVVAIIARLEMVKGHDYVLDAIKMLKDHDVTLLVAGTGSLEAHLQERVREEGLTRVRMLGFVSNIAEIENCMDLQINASYGTEATSYSLLEGMSLGIPAVVSDFGGNPYVILQGKTGLVVRQKDAKALADGILQLKQQPALYRQMAENAVADFQQRFTAKHMTDQISRLYRKLYRMKEGKVSNG